MPKETSYISDKLSQLLSVKYEDVENLLTKPKEVTLGDYSVPLFMFAKQTGKNPAQLAQELASQFPSNNIIASAIAAGPYINFFLHRPYLLESTIKEVLTKGAEFGSFVPLVSYTYILDYSAPNIAKPFGIGHLRSTVIGGSIKNILQFSGHRVIGWNYLGDWGTQFAKLIWAFTHWGSQEALQADPITYLHELYVRYHTEAEANPVMDDEARAIFAALEKGDAEYVALWNQFRTLSLADYERVYQILGTTFDIVQGEAYYNDKMQAILEELQQKNLLTESDGAQIVDFEKHNLKLPNIIVKKSNDSTTYFLRDLALAFDRFKNYACDFALCEVGQEQKMHFAQVKAILKLMGHDFSDRMIHIDHGLYRFNDEKMSTRKGNIVKIEDVLAESIARVKAIIQEKNPELAASEGFDDTAKDIGVGAVVFFDLVNDRTNDVNFTWEKVLDFGGDSGPYVQYTHARICSVLRKYGQKLSMTANYEVLTHDIERELALHIGKFSESLDNSARNYKPHNIARYLIELAQLYNKYYQNVQIIDENVEITQARVLLCAAVRQVLENGLSLLGMAAPRRM